MCDLENKCKSDGWNTHIHNGGIRLQISKSIKDITHFAFIISKISVFQICDLENVGQFRGVNSCNDAIWRRISTFIQVMAGIVMLALTVLEILTFQLYDLENVWQSHQVHICSDAIVVNTNIYKSHIVLFYAWFNRFQDIHVSNVILNIYVKLTEYNIHIDAIRCRISTSVKVMSRIFTLALIFF